MEAISSCNNDENQMELMLELDEEEASLLEEMERQETSQTARPKSHVDVEEQESLVETSAVISGEAHELVDEHSEKGKVVKANQENLLERHSKSFQNSKVLSNIEKTNSSEESHQEPLTYCFLDGIQILKLDMSESELELAKSVAAQKLYSCQSHVNATSSGSTSQFLNSFSSKDNEEKYLKCILNAQKEDFPKTASDTKHKTKFKTCKLRKKKKIQATKILKTQTKDRHKKQSPDNRNCCSSQAKRKKLNIMDLQESRLVNFQCNLCDFHCPFKEENIDEIVEHITPGERFNHLLEILKRFEDFKETIRLSMLIAKNKAKAKVRFYSYIECTTCNQQFPLTLDSCDQFLIHYNWCKKIPKKENFLICPYCSNAVRRASIKRHLSIKSRNHCTMNVAVTLQLMSFVCKRYAESHQPVCIVCNEKRWPYLGHRAELGPVCEICRFNITSGNTTKLRNRDLAGCAICGSQCSEKFVTYWASELESLFIGEKCISKLESPATKRAVHLATMKKDKVRKFVESAIKCAHVHEKAYFNIKPSDSAISLDESIENQESQSFASSSASNSIQDENPLPNNAVSLNGSNSSHQSHCFISSNSKKSLQSGAFLMKQDCGSILNESKIQASLIKQKKLGHCDLPVSPRANIGGFIPVTGSFKFNNGLKLPITPVTSIADKLGGGETVESKSLTEMDKVKHVQGDVPYSLLLPNDAPKVVYRRCMPNMTSDSVKNTKTTFRAIKPRLHILPTSVNDDAAGVKAVLSTETPVISFRSKSKTSVSLRHPCKVTSRPSSLFQIDREPQQEKYVIKYASTLSNSNQDTNSDQNEKNNSSCIVIKTSSNTSKTEVPTLSPLWVAQVFKTNENVCHEDLKDNDKLERKTKRKTSLKIKDEEALHLD